LDFFFGPTPVHPQQLVSGVEVDNFIIDGIGADEAKKAVGLDRICRVHNHHQQTPET
jgi:hypothetical protein